MKAHTHPLLSETIFRRMEANDPIADQIFSFMSLPDGWHYGEGCGATEAAVSTALRANGLLAKYGADAIEVFPDTEGGILVSGYHGQDTLDIFCHRNGQTDLLHETDEGDVDEDVIHEQKGVSLSDIEKYLRGLSWRSMKSSDFFIQSISAGKNSDSQVLLSKTLQTMAAYRSSTQNVRWIVVEANANISDVSMTPEYRETRRSSGEYQYLNSPKKLAWNTNHQPAAINAT